jgi:hypothetical protein
LYKHDQKKKEKKKGKKKDLEVLFPERWSNKKPKFVFIILVKSRPINNDIWKELEFQ